MDKRRLVTFFLMYTVLLLLYFQWNQSTGKQQKPVPPEQRIAAAQKLEQEADSSSSTLALNQRVEKYNNAINIYNEIAQQQKGAASFNGFYQQIRILDKLSALEPTNTAYQGQQEQLLKDMRGRFAGQRVSVMTPEGQQVPPPISFPANYPRAQGTVAYDYGDKWSADKLSVVRYERDQRYRHSPLYAVLDYPVKLTGSNPNFSYWFALVFITVVIKMALWPFTKRQFTYQRDMQRVAPLVKQMQERMKGRPADEINREMMRIYKENNVSLTGGCLPMVLQMVVLIPMYSAVQYYEYQFENGKFLWVGSALSQQFPSWVAPSMAGFDIILFVLYVGSTVVYSMLQPKPADPQQAQQQKMMMWMFPAIFGVMMFIYKWSAAFMFYWLVLNLVSIYQNWRLLREFGHPNAAPAVEGAGPAPELPRLERLNEQAPRTVNGRRTPTRKPVKRRR